MRCISLWQPWATLWLLSNPDEKLFETRHWYTRHRGPLLVHAAKKRDREILEAVYDEEIIPALIRHGVHGIEQLAFGAILGWVHLVDCRRMSEGPEFGRISISSVPDRERSFGDWTSGRYAWKRSASPILFKEPIPWRGSQGFFDVPDAVVRHELLPVCSGGER